MKKLVVSFLLLASLPMQVAAQSASNDHSHGGAAWEDEREINSLAKNLDNVVKVCAEISLFSGTGKTDIGKTRAAAEQSGVLTFQTDAEGAAVPDHEKFGKRTIGRWLDPHAAITVIKYSKPVCQILVSESAWISKVRPSFYELLQVGNFYQPTGEEIPTPEGQSERVFQANLGPNAQITPTVRVTGIPAMANQSPRLAITVAMIPKVKN